MAGILSLPENEQGPAYEAAHQALTAQGYKINLPSKWSPSLKPQLQAYAVQVPKYLEMLGNQPVPMGGGGGAAAPGGPMPGGGGGYTPQAFVADRIKRGDDPVTAAAWAGNAEHESGFNPTAFNPKDPNGGSHGLIQWNGPRAMALRQFATARGGNPADPQVQQDFLQSEIDADPQFKAQLAAAPAVQDKAALISMKFIRPAGGQPEALARGQTATKYTMGTVPPELAARGANAAPMPNVSPQQVGAAPGTPAQMPNPSAFMPTNTPAQNVPNGLPQMPNGPQAAQAGGAPALPPQGGGEGPDVRRPLAPLPTTSGGTIEHDVLKQIQLPPGAQIVKRKGAISQPQPDSVEIMYPNGQLGIVRLPPKKEPTDPANLPTYRWNEDKTAQTYIPGSSADPEVIKRNADVRKTASEKAIPQTVVKGMQENLDALKQVDRALGKLGENPGSVGGIGSTLAANLPGVGSLQNRWGDPEGTQLRALIADIGSLKIHDRSGAAVTASEFPRLRPFIPSISDDPKTVETKLKNFKAVYEQTLRDTSDYYNADNGFKAHGPTENYLNGGQQPQAAKPSAAPNPGDVVDGYVFNGGDPSKQENWRKAQ